MSIMDKYRRQKANFVNREEPITIIQEKLDALHSDSVNTQSELVNFWGLGGEGKTELKKEIREKYDYKNNHTKHKTNLTNYIIVEWDADVHFHRNYSLPEVLISFRNQFVRYGYQMEEFTKYITFYRHYTAMILPDLFDENEENITKPLLKGMLDVVSFSTGLNSLVEGALGFVQAAQQNNKSKKLKEEYEQFGEWRDDAATMQAILLDAFIHDVNSEVEEQKIIFMLDTFEDVRSSNLDWIFPKNQTDTDEASLFYSLQPALWLVFGREKVELNDRQTSFQLEHFNKRETDKYIDENLQKYITEEHDQVFDYTRGYPLLLSDLHARLTKVKDTSLEKVLVELKKNDSIKNVIIERYKEYFLKEYYSNVEITLLKVFFTYRHWKINTEDITMSPVYQFASNYIGNKMNQAETLELENAFNKLLNLSFIRELSSKGREITYGIDKTIYEALKDEAIEGVPIIPVKLQEDMVEFFMRRLEVNQLNQLTAEVYQMVELLGVIYADEPYDKFYKKLMHILQERNIDGKLIIYIQLLVLEEFEKVELESKSGQEIIDDVLENIKYYGLFDDIDRLIHLLENVENQRWLNEKIGYYLFAIHKYNDAKKFIEAAIPALEKFKYTDVYRSFKIENQEDNIYHDKLYRILSIEPHELIAGYQAEAETKNEDVDMQAYRKFLHNVGLLIRIKLKLGNSFDVKLLLARWSVAISYDREMTDIHYLYELWYALENSLLENTVWVDIFLMDLKDHYLPYISEKIWILMDEPEFAMTMVKMSNRLLEIEAYELADEFYHNVSALLSYLLQNPRKDGQALLKMLNSEYYTRLHTERSLLYLTKGRKDITESKDEIANVKVYYEKRIAEDWQQSIVLSEALEVCFLDVKLLDYLDEKESCIKVLNEMIDRVKEITPNNYHLGECYFLKGKYLMELGNWTESYESFHQAGKIARKNLGVFAETSRALIPYETYENYTYMYLLQKHRLPVSDEVIDKFSERLQLNKKMIDNYYDDNLPNALQLYRLGMQAEQGIEYLENESLYAKNCASLKGLLKEMTIDKYRSIIERFGKYMFMDILAKYEEEYMARAEDYHPVIISKEVDRHLADAKSFWENQIIPEHVKNEFYLYARNCIDELIKHPEDLEKFFKTYFIRMKAVFHKNNAQNEVSEGLGRQIISSIDVLSNMNYHREKVISYLVKVLG